MLEMMGVLAAVVLAVRARRRFEAALGGLLLLVSLQALWSATRIEETIFDHEVFWMSSLGALNIALLVSPGVRPFAARTLTARVTAAVRGRVRRLPGDWHSRNARGWFDNALCRQLSPGSLTPTGGKAAIAQHKAPITKK
jgi:hypothetical protein